VKTFHQHDVSDPLRRLTATAHRVAQNADYSVRAQEEPGEELGVLTRAFNQMLARIQSQEAALHETARKLAIQVAALQRDVIERTKAEAALHAVVRRIRDQQAAVGSFATAPDLATGDEQAIARAITEVTSRVAEVERASVWLFNESESEFRCVDLYEATPARHSGGRLLSQEQFRVEFEALKTSRYIVADDPWLDPRTAGSAENYLKPLRITSVLDAVIRGPGSNLGVYTATKIGISTIRSQVSAVGMLGDIVSEIRSGVTLIGDNQPVAW